MSGTKDVDMNVQGLVVEGDTGAAHYTIEWTQVGDFMGMIPADGKRLVMRGHDFVRFKDGFIAEIWHCEDLFGIMGQLGLIPPAG
jgi:predicted ester cyclase